MNIKILYIYSNVINNVIVKNNNEKTLQFNENLYMLTSKYTFPTYLFIFALKIVHKKFKYCEKYTLLYHFSTAANIRFRKYISKVECAPN